MALDPNAVGQTGEPQKRSWTSKDSLLYAVGVGAGTSELAFSTENTKEVPQRVLPTQAVILGGGGAPMHKIGEFNPAMLVHGEEGIELFDEIPPEGEIESTGRIKAMWDKGEGKGAVVEMESESVNVATGKPLFKVFMSLFIRGEGGFGGERGGTRIHPLRRWAASIDRFCMDCAPMVSRAELSCMLFVKVIRPSLVPCTAVFPSRSFPVTR